ncbi:MAG: hypothetical protein V1750_00550, partial [Acidobacteriota bacterium]
AALGLLYRPVLGMELMGDDYQWVQHAHAAMHRPALLLADLDTFYRPANTWTLALDRLLWGFAPLGYRITNLLLQGLAAIALAAVGRRLGLAMGVAWAVAALWACSPFTFEPAASVAIRFENLLFLGWLGLIGAWPQASERWSAGRLAAAGVATFLAMVSKETWVVTAALAWALATFQQRRFGWGAVRAALPFGAAALAYVAAYFLAFPTGKGYYRFALAPLAKVPHQLAAFLSLETLTPVSFPFSWKGILGCAMVAAAVVLILRRRLAAGAVGAALLLAPMLPTLFVPYLPTRYTAIPYAGFLLLVAACLVALLAELAPRVRLAAALGATSLAAMVLAAGAFTVGADLRDWKRLSDAHARLLVQARAVARDFSPGRPVLVVRQERDNPLRDVAASPEGLPKLLYPRGPDPAGLIDAAALVDWVIGREDVLVRRIDDGERSLRDASGAVLAHRSGGFVWLAQETAALGEQAARWRARGLQTRIIRAGRTADTILP